MKLLPSSFSATRGGFLLDLEVAGLELGALGLEHLGVPFGGAQGLAARQQEIAGEAVLDADPFAHLAELRHAFEQNDFHVLLLFSFGEEGSRRLRTLPKRQQAVDDAEDGQRHEGRHDREGDEVDGEQDEPPRRKPARQGVGSAEALQHEGHGETCGHDAAGNTQGSAENDGEAGDDEDARPRSSAGGCSRAGVGHGRDSKPDRSTIRPASQRLTISIRNAEAAISTGRSCTTCRARRCAGQFVGSSAGR